MDDSASLPPLIPGLDLPRARVRPEPAAPRCSPRLKEPQRHQPVFRMVDIEELIDAEHPARAIWDLVGGLDLSRFYAPIEAGGAVAGRPAWDPRLLISLWVYAYSRGISSGREVARRCLYDPAFQWLCGLEEVNYHTLTDFRSTHGEALPGLFVQVLGVLSAQGLVGMERWTQDGTKIKAQASKKSFLAEAGLQEHLAAAREQVEALSACAEEGMAVHRAARERAAQERLSRVEEARRQFEQLCQEDKAQARRAQRRVSVTDPEARVMKQPDGGYSPSYNVQLTTDALNKVIVAVGVTNSGNDWQQLVPGVDRAEQNLGRAPQEVLADTGYVTRSNVAEMEARAIDLYGPCRSSIGTSTRAAEGFGPSAFTYEVETDTYRCPMGTVLTHSRERTKDGAVEHSYRASLVACAACPFRSACCGREEGRGRLLTRVEEPQAMTEFRAKMETEEAKATYKVRAAVAEFPHAWLKEKLGLRQFRLRGLVKTGLEALWACLTYNIQQWIRLAWRKGLGSAA